MIEGSKEPGTAGDDRASIPTVARRGRAGVGVLALVVLSIGASSACESAPPPSDTPAPTAEAESISDQTASTPDEDRAPSLARRIAPLLRVPEPEPEPEPPPEPEPIGEDIPSTGVAACDEFLRKYLRCVDDSMPEPSRPTMRKAIEDMAKTWAEMDPGASDTLAEACRQASEATRKAMESMGCRWE